MTFLSSLGPFEYLKSPFGRNIANRTQPWCLICSKPTAEVLTEYTRKVDFLKGLLEAEKLVSWVSDVSIRLCWTSGDVPGSHVCPVLCQPSPTDKALANQFLAPGRTPTIGHERMSATKTVHMQTKGRCTAQMRSELLDTVGADGGCSRCSQLRNGCTAAEITSDKCGNWLICCVFAGAR